jgi:hypothetical protein
VAKPLKLSLAPLLNAKNNATAMSAISMQNS